ncbi:MAG: fused MFS/spermidine synthase [Planctomycetes bacterium]|nr:fused MFS/spermidine synthase [Planctomycetota bacterium]
MRSSDVVFFLTGVAALGYETVWARLMARVLGSDAPAAALVLSVFMAGLGLGAYAFAGIARASRAPVRLFIALELCVALWAVLTPTLIANLPVVDSWTARAFVAAGVMLPPIVLMGATFPLMARMTIRSDAETASETSAFYGANTLGAAVGALITPFVAMPLLGLNASLYAAAALEVGAAALAWRVLQDPPVHESATQAARGPARAAWREPLLWSAFLFGTAALALEVLLLRLLVTVTGASVYAFSIVTFVFLFGIGIGSRQLTERRTRTGLGDNSAAQRAAKSRDAVFWAGICLPFLALAGLLALRYQLGEGDLFSGLENRVAPGASVWRMWAGHALFAGLALLPPAIAFGLALPSCAAALVGERADRPREHTLGLVYAWNTCGALVGSLVAGFVLMPVVGPRTGVALAVALTLCAAWCAAPRRGQTVFLAAIAASAVGWLVLGTTERGGARVVVLHTHDAHTSALVEDTPTSHGERVRSLRVNGKSEASTAPVDVRLQYLLGHVPALLHGRVERALVIGLGTGMTAGSLLDADSLRDLRIVEISRAVATAARTFADWNGNVLDDARTTLVIADGRHYLATTEWKFDLITSDPVHPWTRGSSDLYTLEHFRRMRAALAPGGVASQWLPLYELSSLDVKTILATWCGAFEHVSAWLSAYDLVLVGSAAPLAHESDLYRLALPPKMLAHDRAIGVAHGVDVAALQVAGDVELRALVGGIEPMLDDRPVIEFRAPKSSMRGYEAEILRWAIRDEYVSRLPVESHGRARAFRSAVFGFLDRLPQGFTVAADRLGSEISTLYTSTR